MRELGFVQIILLIVFILVPLIKFVVEQVKRRLEGKIPQSASATQIRQQTRAKPATSPTPRVPRDQVGGLQTPVVLSPLDKRYFTRTSLLGTPREVRRGIVLMTILGPCRAFDPPDYPIPNSFLQQEISLQSRQT